MEVTITGKHLEITDAIREYASNKVAKLPRYYDRVTAIEVVADKPESYLFEVELIVRAERTDPFIATRKGEDLYGCIDDAVNKIERQLHEHKEKLRNRKHING